METTVINATEYRNVSLSVLTESKTNPRRTFEPTALKELAESIRIQGILSPLLVRPLTENGFEIIAGARRFRAAQIAKQSSVPIRIVNFSDAAALEAQLVENLIRSEIHSDGRSAGLPRFARFGRTEVQHRADCRKGWEIARLHRFEVEISRPRTRRRRGVLMPDEIGVGHALLLAKLPARPTDTGARPLASKRYTTMVRSQRESCCPSATCNSGLTVTSC